MATEPAQKRKRLCETTTKKICPMIAKNRENTQFATLFDELVTIEVSPEKKLFQIHKGLICHHSEYFRGAFKGGFKESESKLVTLKEEVDHLAFQAFYQWLYTGKIRDDEDEISWEASRDCQFLFNTYIFGDAHGIPDFQNTIVDRMYTSFMDKSAIPVTYIKNLYEHTTKGDNLRRFLVDIFQSMSQCEAVEFFSPSDQDHYPQEFLFELSKALLEDDPGRERPWTMKDWGKLDTCRYHNHKDINAAVTAAPGAEG
ncbi:hypothetical protein EJ08DRAFT_692493 [Tothia fuscella]|uniref:BTB domain-containing protein n=1 Tax=Tothia fuscella TaxID=1048955 RepID=A0A9P4U3T0_9PEZI|nr:hypothetical protein EJ08DRAFT_692493 [Tothia fuscella]